MVSKGCGRPARFVTRSTNSDGIESLCTSYSPLFATTAPSPNQTIPAHQAGRRASFSLDENMGEACTKVRPSGYCNISILYTINEEMQFHASGLPWKQKSRAFHGFTSLH